MSQHGIAHSVYVPLVQGDRSWGVLAAHPRHGALGESEVEFLRAMASLLSLAAEAVPANASPARDATPAPEAQIVAKMFVRRRADGLDRRSVDARAALLQLEPELRAQLAGPAKLELSLAPALPELAMYRYV